MAGIKTLTGILAGAAVLAAMGGCSCDKLRANLIDTPQVKGLRLVHDVTGKTQGSLARLEYFRGAKFDVGFLGTEVEFEGQDAISQKQSSGIVLISGLAFVDAQQLPLQSNYNPAASSFWTFWPIIRTRRVIIGAEGTKFLVQSLDPPEVTAEGSLVARVFKVDGTVVLVQAPNYPVEVRLKDNRNYAEVYLKALNTYTIVEKPDYNRDVTLKQLVEKAERDMQALQSQTPGG
jgi:hypothetical protein